MTRASWLAQRRAAVIATYDSEAAAHDQHEYPSDTQREEVVRLAKRLPVNSLVMDAVRHWQVLPVPRGGWASRRRC
jgi:hypothetical protein